MKFLFVIFGLLAMLYGGSCTEKQQLVCTNEFRFITINYTRENLDTFYTIRELTGDTLHFDMGNIFGDRNYPVLDDSFQQTLAGKTESFRFQGTINNNIVVNELFVIKADQCHIEYVSGNTVVH